MVDAKSIFLAALELPAAERPAWLARACGGDAAVHDRVVALLAAHAAAGSFLAAPHVPGPTGEPPAPPNDHGERATERGAHEPDGA